MMAFFYLLLAVYYGLLISPGSTERINYYVTPNPFSSESECLLKNPCFTLDQYARNSSQFFNDYTNYSLILFNGVHDLTTRLFISGVQQLSIYGHHSSNHSRSELNTSFKGKVTVYNVSKLRIARIKIISKKVDDDVQLSLSKIHCLTLFHVQFGRIRVAIINKHTPPVDATVSIISSKLLFTHLTINLNGILLSIQETVVENGMLDMRIALTSRHNGMPQRKLLIVGCTFTGLSSNSLQLTTEAVASLHIDILNSTFAGSNTFINRPIPGLVSTRSIPGLSVVLEQWAQVEIYIQHCRISALKVEVKRESVLSMNIASSTFISEMDTVASSASGNGIAISQAKFSNVHLNVQDTEIKHQYAGIFMQGLEQEYSLLNLSNVSISNNIRAISFFSSGQSTYINIVNTEIFLNKFDRSIIHINTLTSSFTHIELVDCYIHHNIGLRGAGIKFLSRPTDSTLIFKNIFFFRNVDLVVNPVIVLVFNSGNFTMIDCTFNKNTGTPVEAISSSIFVTGRTVFEGNTARKGGGLSLISSRLVFTIKSTLIFASNTAQDVGGAIYVSKILIRENNSPGSILPDTLTQCFFQIPNLYNAHEFDKTGISLSFFNNSAENGGEDIYGTYLYYSCIVSSSNGVILPARDVRQLFKVRNGKNTSLSAISSDPKRVCICNENGEPQCANLDYIYLNATLYPGETFTLSLVVTGDEFGTVTAPAHANLLSHSSGSLGQGQRTQLVHFKQCSNVEYSVHSSNKFETIVLTAAGSTPAVVGSMGIDDVRLTLSREKFLVEHYIFTYKQRNVIRSEFLYTPIYYNVTLSDCPLGFELIGDPPSCQCHHSLITNNLKNCVIVNHTGLVYRSGTTWVNATFNTNETNGVVVHKHCPYSYCRSENTSVDLRYPDMQCALGHSGILCGGCQHNLSLAIGSNRCLQCPNSNHSSLLIFFAIAGFALVFFIKLLDFTVSKGTINGLIFYANIVWAEQSILFSNHENQHIAQRVVTVFIAWLNLDFGIETCFAQGVNAYQKTWLQFIFPVYVWSIAGFMIITSYYSTIATKIFGNNSVPVLATLLLMSYAKLLRTIITTFGFALLRYPDSTMTVWLFDGNVPYFGLEHSFLFLAAVSALLFLWLPYMSTLILVPWLKRKTHLKPFRWIIRWKPFYDAYFGPFKQQHQYWVGLLLVARVFLFILFATTSSAVPNVNLVAMVVLPTVILAYVSHMGYVYSNKYLSLLENSFFLNLIALGVGTLYQNVVGEDKDPIVYVSIGVVFIQFMCIVLYHCVIAAINRTTRRNNQQRNTVQIKSMTRLNERRMCPLREELLESDSHM